MPIIRSDLTSRSGPRGQRAEYTRKCGWIDWAHATPDRDDLKAIWKALNPPPIKPDGSTDTDRIALIEDAEGKLSSYLRVDFSLEMSWKQRAGSRFPKQNYTFFVKVKHGNPAPAFYKNAALTIYLYGCAMVEYHQSARILEWKAHSSFSMEDMISNLMAFYQVADGLSPAALIDRAGGWSNQADSLKYSTEVFDAMDARDAAQPKSKWSEWYKAYLFNDIANLDDKRGGWQMLPPYFQSYQYLNWSKDDKPGTSDIGYEWDEYKLASNTPQPGQSPTEYLAQVQAQQRAGGRVPGPLGRA